MIYNLQNKVALVTGGSRGLGAAISRALGQSGAKVAINYFSRSAEAKNVRAEILESDGEAEVFRADITDEVEVADLCAKVVDRFGSIDILVVNATLIHVHKAI